MKRTLALVGLAFPLCALVCAQESTGDRIVVPARNSTHPRELHVHSTHGSITVKAYTGKDVIVEVNRGGSRRGPDRTSDGLRRIELPPRGVAVEEEDNVIRVGSHSPETGNIVISVPPDTAVQAESTNGSISIEGVHGEIVAHDTNGGINITNVSGSVVADTTNGGIKVVMDRVDPSKPIAFSSNNGTVDVTLPADVKATLKLSTTRGEVWSDFEMKLTGGQPTTSRSGDGQFRVDFNRTIFGTINGGGVEASFRTLNGSIKIRKK